MEEILPFAACQRLARWLFDRLTPRRCLVCGAVSGMDEAAVCARCWGGLDFIIAPRCGRCGVPFEQQPPLADSEEVLCGACLMHPPPYRQARAVWRYDAASRRILLPFKHADATDAAPALARFLCQAAPDLIARANVIVPVPLHPRRLFWRRYNQAALLAWQVGRKMGRPVMPDALVRRRSTPSQAGLGRLGRARNVRGAFAVRPGAKAALRGRQVLLIDDVHTTGATIAECSRVLLRGGAAAVDVLTLARAVLADG